MDHAKLHPYPASLPDGWLLHLLAVARGNLDPKREVHFVWHIAGYAASQFDVHGLTAMDPGNPLDPLAYLEMCQESGATPDWDVVKAVCDGCK